jgi:hypothetical protein
MQHKAIAQPCAGCGLSDAAREDAQVQHAVLGVIIDQLPCLLTVPELIREVGPDERDAVERAVADLAAAGLLRRQGDSALPTRAAMHSALLGAVAQ